MGKIRKIIFYALLMSFSTTGYCVEEGVEDPTLVAASYQQGDAVDPAPPVVAQSSQPSSTRPLLQKIDQLDRQIAQQHYIIYGLLAWMCLLTLLHMMRRRKRSTRPAAVAPASDKTKKVEDDTEDEYDFMSTHEAIPAKLDLARAYIDMDDEIAARETLAQILGDGNESQRDEARALLAKINAAS